MPNPDNEGLSIGYRIRYRLQVLVYSVLGPAQQAGMADPVNRLRADRAARVEKARAARLAREQDD